jgi:hypothetical protein
LSETKQLTDLDDLKAAFLGGTENGKQICAERQDEQKETAGGICQAPWILEWGVAGNPGGAQQKSI